MTNNGWTYNIGGWPSLDTHTRDLIMTWESTCTTHLERSLFACLVVCTLQHFPVHPQSEHLVFDGVSLRDCLLPRHQGLLMTHTRHEVRGLWKLVVHCVRCAITWARIRRFSRTKLTSGRGERFNVWENYFLSIEGSCSFPGRQRVALHEGIAQFREAIFRDYYF